jgi:hypothetical protein
MKYLTYIIRLFALILILPLLVFNSIRVIVMLSINHLRYGSEWITYTKKATPETFGEIIKKLIDESERKD